MDLLLTARPFTDPELFIRILAAVVIGVIIGTEREYKNRPAGMRTHALVCLGSATIAVLESMLVQRMNAQPGAAPVALSLGRMSAQVISGIGFLGAGTIFVSQKKIAGLTTAASVWVVACMGLLCGFGYYLFALLNAALVIVVLFLQRVIHVNQLKHVEVRFIRRDETLPFITAYFSAHKIDVLDVDFHVETPTGPEDAGHGLCINIYTLHLPRKVAYSDIVRDLSQHKNIRMVRTRTM